ncbi:MAG: pilus assembly protein PilM [bacterium]|nr:pilus assembly protein PilM [bacterium]
MFYLTSKDVSAGLDIGSHSIKLIKLKRGKKVKILNAEKVLLPQDLIRGSFINENIRDQKVFTGKIKELFSIAGLSDKEVAVGIPDTSARSIFLELENVPENKEDAKELIKWKLKKDIDSNLDKNFAIDYHILKKDTKDKKDLYRLFVVLSNKKILAEYEDSLRNIGLKPVSLTLSSFGLINFINFIEKRSDNSLIINLGHQVTTLFIIKDQKLAFMRSIDIGGRDFTSEVKEHFSLNWEDAEKKKRENIFFPESIEIPELMNMSVLDNFSSIKLTQGNLIREISLSLRHYEDKTGESAIKKILLSGGTADFRNINIFIKNIFNLDTFKIDQLEKIDLLQNIGAENLSTYASVIGLLL